MVITSKERSGHYIDGAWTEADGTEFEEVYNPATEDVIATVPTATEDEVDRAINAANRAQYEWGHVPAKNRGLLVRQVADLILDNRDELSQLLSMEQGKPISEARGEIEAAADMASYNAEWDRRIEGDILPGDFKAETIHLQRHPVGTVAAIVPWNYPVAVFIRKFAPALVAGNTLVAKPSEETPLTTIRLIELIDEYLEFPDGVVNLITGPGSVGAELVSSNEVDMVSMTGSVETGKQVMSLVASNLTKVSLELGGKAPVIVWNDADIERAVQNVLTARITNTGQVCTCAERVYVHADILEEFERRYVEAAQDVRIGLPEDDPDMGPQVSAQEREKTEAAVRRALDEGAELGTGGSRPNGDLFAKGYWYEPTVLTGVQQDMDIMHQEVFGPVTPIMEVESLEEAIEFANDTTYGLSSYLFTDNYRTAMRVAEDLQFGETYINRTLGESWHGHHIGWNESGLGGEDGKYGFLKYTQLKTVYHNYS